MILICLSEFIDKLYSKFFDESVACNDIGHASCLAFLDLVPCGKGCHFSFNGDAKDTRSQR